MRRGHEHQPQLHAPLKFSECDELVALQELAAIPELTRTQQEAATTH
jgi:hypothetical protein